MVYVYKSIWLKFFVNFNCHPSSKIEGQSILSFSHLVTVHREIFALVIFSPLSTRYPRANLRLRESESLSLNKTESGQVQDGGNYAGMLKKHMESEFHVIP